jgi:hypothetical protein
MWPYALERMSRISSSSGLLCNWIYARWILCCSSLIRAPFARLFSLANLPSQMSTLLVAASNHPGQSAFRLGGGWVPFVVRIHIAYQHTSLPCQFIAMLESKYMETLTPKDSNK